MRSLVIKITIKDLGEIQGFCNNHNNNNNNNNNSNNFLNSMFIDFIPD